MYLRHPLFLVRQCLFISGLYLFFSCTVLADDVKKEVVADEVISDVVVDQLTRLTDNIKQYQSEIKTIDRQLQKTTQTVEIEQLTLQRKNIQERLDEHNQSLEQIATGKVDLSLFEIESDEKSFSWQDEITDILKPVLSELKKITERPRQLELLRSQQASLQTRLVATNLAVKEIDVLLVNIKSSQVKITLTKLLKKWSSRKEDIENKLQLIQFQIEEKINAEEHSGQSVFESLKTFVTGRGLHLFLAFFAFLASLMLLRYVSHLIELWINRGNDKERRFMSRLVHVVFQVLSVLIAVFALMTTLYILGDWFILTLVIILLVGATFALRNSIPKYLDEVRLLLNVGPVREGERVIYQGLPWRVSRLNIHSTLVNPVLTGGRLRVPMSEMLSLVSRRWSRDEPWFPSKVGDYVSLDDSTFGEVALQTPEIVQLTLNGGSRKTYSVGGFLDQNPRNLSEGFGVFVNFGLDYDLQPTITTEVVSVLESDINKRLAESEYAQYLIECRVEFATANASSLDLLIITLFSGDAAMYYLKIQRFLQRVTVDTCNHNQWSIPFSQMTVHLNRDDS